MAQPLRGLLVLAICCFVYYCVLCISDTTTTASTPAPEIPLPIHLETSLLPYAPGTISNCFAYRNYREISPIKDQLESPEKILYKPIANACGYIANLWEVTIDDLIKWNPSLNKDNCSFQPGYSYCVVEREGYKRPDPRPTMIWCERNVTESKIPAGTTSKCTCFAEIFGDDADDPESCEGLMDGLGLDPSYISKWNPWVGSDCDAGLYAGLAPGDSRLVCRGISKKWRVSTSSTDNLANGITG